MVYFLSLKPGIKLKIYYLTAFYLLLYYVYSLVIPEYSSFLSIN